MGATHISAISNVANDTRHNADVEESQPCVSRCPFEVFVAVCVEFYAAQISICLVHGN